MIWSPFGSLKCSTFLKLHNNMLLTFYFRKNRSSPSESDHPKKYCSAFTWLGNLGRISALKIFQSKIQSAVLYRVRSFGFS